MQSSIGALIAAVRRRLTQLILGRAAHHQLSAQQFWMMVAIRETPGISQVDIAERTLSDAASVSRALSGLSDRGLVEIATDPGDRRRSHVRLTPAGDRLAGDLAPVAGELRDAMVAGLSPAEVRSLCALLERLLANLEDLAHRAPQGAGA